MMNPGKNFALTFSCPLNQLQDFNGFGGEMSSPVWLSEVGSGYFVFGDKQAIYGFDSKGHLAWKIEARISFSSWTIYHQEDLYVIDGHVLCYYNMNGFLYGQSSPLNALNFKTHKTWSFQGGTSIDTLFETPPPAVQLFKKSLGRMEWVRLLKEIQTIKTSLKLTLESQPELDRFLKLYDLPTTDDKAISDFIQKEESAHQSAIKEMTEFNFSKVLAPLNATSDKHLFVLNANGQIFSLSKNLSVKNAHVARVGATPDTLELFFSGEGKTARLSYISEGKQVLIDPNTMNYLNTVAIEGSLDDWVEANRVHPVTLPKQIKKDGLCNDEFHVNATQWSQLNEFDHNETDRYCLVTKDNGQNASLHLFDLDQSRQSFITTKNGPGEKLNPSFYGGDFASKHINLLQQPWLRTEEESMFVYSLLRPYRHNQAVLQHFFQLNPDTLTPLSTPSAVITSWLDTLKTESVFEITRDDKQFLPLKMTATLTFSKLKLLKNDQYFSDFINSWNLIWLQKNYAALNFKASWEALKDTLTNYQSKLKEFQDDTSFVHHKGLPLKTIDIQGFIDYVTKDNKDKNHPLRHKNLLKVLVIARQHGLALGETELDSYLQKEFGNSNDLYDYEFLDDEREYDPFELDYFTLRDRIEDYQKNVLKAGEELAIRADVVIEDIVRWAQSQKINVTYINTAVSLINKLLKSYNPTFNTNLLALNKKGQISAVQNFLSSIASLNGLLRPMTNKYDRYSRIQNGPTVFERDAGLRLGSYDSLERSDVVQFIDAIILFNAVISLKDAIEQHEGDIKNLVALAQAADNTIQQEIKNGKTAPFWQFVSWVEDRK